MARSPYPARHALTERTMLTYAQERWRTRDEFDDVFSWHVYRLARATLVDLVEHRPQDLEWVRLPGWSPCFVYTCWTAHPFNAASCPAWVALVVPLDAHGTCVLLPVCEHHLPKRETWPYADAALASAMTDDLSHGGPYAWAHPSS